MDRTVEARRPPTANVPPTPDRKDAPETPPPAPVEGSLEDMPTVALPTQPTPARPEPGAAPSPPEPVPSPPAGPRRSAPATGAAAPPAEPAQETGPRIPARASIIAAILLLVAVIGLGGWWLFSRGKTGGPESLPPGTVQPAAASPTVGTPVEEGPDGETLATTGTAGTPAVQRPRASKPGHGRGGRRTGSSSSSPPPTRTSSGRAGTLPRSGFVEGFVDVSHLSAWPEPAAVLFAKKNFKGRSQRFAVGKVPHLRGTRIGDNAVTSLKVEGGARLTLFLKPNFAGRHETFTADCPSLKERRIRNNRASSLRVDPPDAGAVLWKEGPVTGLAIAFTVERRVRGVVVRPEGDPAFWIVPEDLHGRTGTLAPLLTSNPALAQTLGSPLCPAVTIARGDLAVQPFEGGVLVYARRSRRGWYRLDTQ